MQDLPSYFGYTYQSGTYGSGLYSADTATGGGSSGGSSSTSTGSSGGSSSSGSGVLTNTGFDIALSATLACAIIFAALLIRFWKHPKKHSDAQ